MFIDNLNNACKMQGISPTYALKKIGKSPAMYTAWKNGAVPKTNTVIELAHLLNVSTDFLLSNSNDIKSDELKLLAMYRQLNSIDKIRIIERLETILNI